MMFAWDLDPDTHSHFRGFLDVFINKRKISKDLREFVLNTRSRAITWHRRPDINLPSSTFNELRISLSYRVGMGSPLKSNSTPILIEKIHPPKYNHNAKEISTPYRRHTNP